MNDPITVLTGGTFDMPHAGHARFLKACNNIAGRDGRVIVFVNSDEFVKRFKGITPHYSQNERMELVSFWQGVDRVCKNIHEERFVDTLTEWIARDRGATMSQFKKQYIVAIGSDWLQKDYLSQTGLTEAWMRENNVSLIYIPYTDGISSTQLRERS